MADRQTHRCMHRADHSTRITLSTETTLWLWIIIFTSNWNDWVFLGAVKHYCNKLFFPSHSSSTLWTFRFLFTVILKKKQKKPKKEPKKKEKKQKKKKDKESEHKILLSQNLQTNHHSTTKLTENALGMFPMHTKWVIWMWIT